MWMPAQTTRPPLRTARSAAGTSSPTRREDDRRVERLGRRLVRAAGPDGAERARERLRRHVARTGEGEDPPSLPARDLRDDMRRRRRSRRGPDVLAFAGHDRASASRSGRRTAAARARRRRRASPSGKAIARIGDVVGGEAAVARVAGEERRSQRFSRPRAAVAATPQVCPSQRNADPLAELDSPSTPRPTASTRPTISWPGNDRQCGSGSSPSTTCRSVRQTPQASTRTTNSRGPVPGRGVPPAQRLARRVQHHGVHRSVNQNGSGSRRRCAR